MQVNRSDPFLVTFPKTLPSDVCREMIDRFEREGTYVRGVTGRGYTPEVKQSDDLHITNRPEWKDIDEILYQNLSVNYQQYVEHIDDYLCGSDALHQKTEDNGYQIQRTQPGGFYDWHSDFLFMGPSDESRIVTYLWYLNDVVDGYTEFISGHREYREEGKLLLFPATWTYQHRGTPPKSLKYICTGWMVQVISGEDKYN